MTKWEYGYANYDGSLLNPVGLAGVSAPGSIEAFLREAGEKGWEMCGVIPEPNPRLGTSGSVELTVIFKRPVESL